MMYMEGLTLRYPDGTCPVENLDLHLAPGESVALVGANGAGKTTLLLSLVGVLPVTAGTIRVGDLTLGKKNLDEIRRRVGLVFQNPDDQLFMPRIRDDVAFGPLNYGKTPQEAQALTEAALEKLGIAHLADKSPTRMSGGEKRMAAIATVLAMEPDVMLFDEPTAFLDPKARRQLIRTMKALPQTRLIATHDLPFACEVCSRVVVLSGGKVAMEGAPRELLYNEKAMLDCGMEAIGYMED